MVVRFPYHKHLKEQWPHLYSNGRHSLENIKNGNVTNVMSAKLYKMLMFLLPELEGVQVVVLCDADKLNLISNFSTLYSRASKNSWWQGFGD